MKKIHNIAGDILDQLSLYLGIDSTLIVFVFIALSGIPHIKVLKNWKEADSNSKYWTRLWIGLVVIMGLAIIFD